MLHPELAEALQRREDELRRKERRRSNLLIGGSIAVNAIISLLLVTAAIASQNAAPLRGSRTVEDAPSYDFMARAHSRKLQQACTCIAEALAPLVGSISLTNGRVVISKPVDILGAVTINGGDVTIGTGGLKVSIGNIEQTTGKFSAGAGGIELGASAGKLKVSGPASGVEVLSPGGLKVQPLGITGGLTVTGSDGIDLSITSGSVVSSLNIAKSGASTLKTGSLEVATQAQIGTNFKKAADSTKPVALLYGDAWAGKEVSGTTTQYLTRIRPGKVIASWPDGNDKAETSIGLKSGDNLATAYSLDVWGQSRLSAKTASTADTISRVLYVHGEGWFGPAAPDAKTPTYLTRVRVGKVTTGWPASNYKPGGDFLVEEASIGRRKTDAATAFQLNVFGNATLANGKFKFTT
ncbi:hypothetical protein ABPG77_000782 [Micractinium sp. CCAP 211/92]